MNIIDHRIKLWQRKQAIDKISLNNQLNYNFINFSPKNILKKIAQNYFKQSKFKTITSTIFIVLFVYKIFKQKS